MRKEMIINVLIGISIVVVAVLILWFMFGDSPTLNQIIVSLILPMYLFIFGVYERLNNKVTATREYLMQTREYLQKELGDMKFKLGQINGKLSK